ncbi:SDR family NAD(P)-dependent oxidoreductase [Nocardioides bizhenqiangii]|uniref:SDR family oxidoreductase n=1 Tax=Nocardioides bizhenqiangii TaxID=3095076 RepID=A0ABZ0ZS79_9ACTN|nr:MULTISPECIES: SDR family oxidoreductase [unclassified Nocardioides]MDZ5619491.1 SDR family oxidoreductase [Nocardioides sp. HM23]WQQ26492.1 SDR family oxidoreductase [Nocardioides sp. HM61]
MDLMLNDKVAVVTGASQGIGLATALTLRAEGAAVVAVSRSRSPRLEAALDDSLVHVPADLASIDGPGRAVAAAVERFGRLDVLVNNVGGPPPGVTMPRFSFDLLDDADWAAMLDFNLLSAVRAVRAALPHLLERGGSIVNVSSTHAHVPSAINVDYGAAKAGLGNLTQALSEEYGPRGVRVNTVTPGPVRTWWWTKDGGAADVLAAATGHDRDTVLDQAAPDLMSLTTGRLIEPQEVADVIALLASPRSASTTGSDFVVDAGLRKAV